MESPKTISKYRFLIPTLLHWITGIQRQVVIPEWSEKSWTHNIFRSYEMVFGRRAGIRAEISSCIDKNGRRFQVAHTFEGQCAIFETWLRNLSSVRLKFEVMEAQFVMVGGQKIALKNYKFIALDAFANGNDSGAVTSKTWSHTCTGTDRIIWGGFRLTTSNFTSFKYNAVSLTQVGSLSSDNEGLFYLINPSTGANNSVIVVGTSANILGRTISFTGSKQSSQPDSNNSGDNGGSTSTLTINTTVVSSNCWLVGCWRISAGSPSQSGLTDRFSGVNTAFSMGDSNGTVGTGSQGFTISAGSNGTLIGLLASFLPDVTNYTSSLSDGILNGASRSSTVARTYSALRSLSDSISTGASRSVTLIRVYGALRSVSAAIMNGASRLTIVQKGLSASISASIMNGASRLVTLARTAHFFRSLSDSILVGAGRKVIDYFIAKWGYFFWD